MNFIFSMHKNIKVLYKWMQSFLLCMIWLGMPKLPKISLHIFSVSPEKNEIDFCLQVNAKIFYKFTVSVWVCIARRAQITQSKTFAISLQYLKKGLNDEVDVLHAGKHGTLLQIDTMILMEMVKHSQSYQNSKFPMFLQYFIKEVRDEV